MSERSDRTSPDLPSLQHADSRMPGRTLLTAAITGLLSMSAAGCDSSSEGDGMHNARDASVTPRITASSVVSDMTLERFTADCDQRMGSVELHAHCGGVNSCQGFSFDDVTLVLTEHGCQGLNTCSGYSCVIPHSS